MLASCADFEHLSLGPVRRHAVVLVPPDDGASLEADAGSPETRTGGVSQVVDMQVAEAGLFPARCQAVLFIVATGPDNWQPM